MYFPIIHQSHARNSPDAQKLSAALIETIEDYAEKHPNAGPMDIQAALIITQHSMRQHGTLGGVKVDARTMLIMALVLSVGLAGMIFYYMQAMD